MLSVNVGVEELTLDQREIWRTMGAVDCAPDQTTLELIDQVQNQMLALARPKFCYTYSQSLDFSYGHIISDALIDGQRFVILVCTVGAEVDEMLHSLREDIVLAFIADTIASELVEAVQRRALEVISSTLDEGEKMSNPYSPGYCGWPLTQQTRLFSYFEQPPCGVVLNDSCLMLPVKSTSAVIAVGPNVVKAPYGCQICTKVDCYKKINRK